MGVQVVEDPVKPLLVGELPRDMGQMGGEIDAGPCRAQVPHDLAGGDDERGDQARVPWRMYSCSRFSGLPGSAGIVGCLSLKDLHPGLLVAADDQSPCWYNAGALTYNWQISRALASKSGSWLLSQ